MGPINCAPNPVEVDGYKGDDKVALKHPKTNNQEKCIHYIGIIYKCIYGMIIYYRIRYISKYNQNKNNMNK